MGAITDVAPEGLVPAAWLVTIGAHLSAVTDRTLLIALVVMDVFLAAFVVASRGEMTGRVLRAWRAVLLGGLALTLLGTAGLAASSDRTPLVAVSLYGWMVLPGLAYVRTGAETRRRPAQSIYLGAAASSLLGAALYALGHAALLPGPTTIVALGVVGIGQTAGIVLAAVQNTGSV